MSTINESQFYMWRTIFALAHADDIVTDTEIRFMVEALEDVPFDKAQMEILTKDIAEAQDIEQMYEKISDPADQAAFFELARQIVWIDGDYGKEEREIMLKLKKLHVRSTNIDDLVGKISLEFEDEATPNPETNVKDLIFSFRDSFLSGLTRKD